MAVLNRPISDVVVIPEDERYPSDWRVLTGLLQPELARRAGIGTFSLQRIEIADQKLSAATARRIADALGISADTYTAAYERCRIRPPGAPS